MRHISKETRFGLIGILRLLLRLSDLIILSVDNRHITHLSDHPRKKCDQHCTYKYEIEPEISPLIKLRILVQIEFLFLLDFTRNIIKDLNLQCMIAVRKTRINKTLQFILMSNHTLLVNALKAYINERIRYRIIKHGRSNVDPSPS